MIDDLKTLWKNQRTENDFMRAEEVRMKARRYRARIRIEECVAKSQSAIVANPLAPLGYFCSLAGVSADPEKTRRPSGMVTVFAFARCEPSLANEPSTVTISPTFNDSLRQPLR
jgi:hypothetical protein